jgi:hypothetical protein
MEIRLHQADVVKVTQIERRKREELAGMRKIVASMMIVLCVVMGAQAQATGSSESPPSLAALLIGLEKRTWTLYTTKQVKELAEVTSEDFVDIYVTGEVVDKQKYLRDVAEVETHSYELSQFHVVEITPDSALVTYTAKVQGTIKGKAINSTLAVTSVWAKRSGRWQNVFYRENLLEFNGKRLL